MRSPHQQRIDRFMLLAGQEVPGGPQFEVSREIRELRARLILEEAFETIEALGCDVTVEMKGQYPDDTEIHRIYLPWVHVQDSQVHKYDITKVVDGCADISVVTIGTLSALGVDDIPVLEAVDQNNLAKFGPGGYRRPDGKWIKPEGHKPPDFASIIDKMRK